MFRKLGMRHMCVIDDEHRLVGILTRKDLMTYRIRENIMSPRAEAMIQQFLYRWRKKREAHLKQQTNGRDGLGVGSGASPLPEGVPHDKDVSETTRLRESGSLDTFGFQVADNAPGTTEIEASHPPPSPIARVSSA